jgi:hypothetical protein
MHAGTDRPQAGGDPLNYSARPAGPGDILAPIPSLREWRGSPAIRGSRRRRPGEEPHCGTGTADGNHPWACGRSTSVRIPAIRRRRQGVVRQPDHGLAAFDLGSAPPTPELAAKTRGMTTMDATRSRRTKDRARQQWYARDRQRRFARFLGFIPGAAQPLPADRTAKS